MAPEEIFLKLNVDLNSSSYTIDVPPTNEPSFTITSITRIEDSVDELEEEEDSQREEPSVEFGKTWAMGYIKKEN